jgi:hypothetical protein
VGRPAKRFAGAQPRGPQTARNPSTLLDIGEATAGPDIAPPPVATAVTTASQAKPMIAHLPVIDHCRLQVEKGNARFQ